MFYLILGLIIFLVVYGIILIATKKNLEKGRALITTAVVIVSFIVLAIAMFAVGFASKNPILDFIEIAITVGFTDALILCFVFGAWREKALMIPVVCGFLVCALVGGGRIAYDVHIDNITITEASDWEILNYYAPFMRNTKAVDLGEPASLSIESDFPVMDGATALYPIYSAFARAVYPESLNSYISSEYKKEIDYYVDCSKTGGAYIAIAEGKADIIFVAAPSEEQEQYAKDKGVELVYTPIGREAFVFFVNSKNPINDISVEEIQGIYSGEIASWDELGVKGLGDIKAFQRGGNSGSQTALKRLMGDKKLMSAPTEDVVGSMGGIINQTADYKNHKNAIGFSFRFYSTKMVANDKIKLLSIDGVYPSAENIENGTYPIVSEFYAVTRADASENTLKLLEWIRSEQGQKIIELTGYTPLN